MESNPAVQKDAVRLLSFFSALPCHCPSYSHSPFVVVITMVRSPLQGSLSMQFEDHRKCMGFLLPGYGMPADCPVEMKGRL